MVKLFCPKCGKDIKDNEKENFVKNYLCSVCLGNQEIELDIEQDYTVYMCTDCPSFSLDKISEKSFWEMYTEENLINKVGNRLYIKFFNKMVEENDFFIDFSFDMESYISSSGNHIDFKILVSKSKNSEPQIYESKIIFKRKICPNCAKIYGKRFDAVIQLRITKIKKGKSYIKEKMDGILNDIKEFTESNRIENPDQLISEIITVNNGYDLHLSNRTLMKKISTEIGNKHIFIQKISKTLMGKSSQTGGDIYRIFLLLRLIPLKIDQIFRIKNDIYRVIKIVSNRIKIENVDTGEQFTKKLEYFEKRTLEILD